MEKCSLRILSKKKTSSAFLYLGFVSLLFSSAFCFCRLINNVDCDGGINDGVGDDGGDGRRNGDDDGVDDKDGDDHSNGDDNGASDDDGDGGDGPSDDNVDPGVSDEMVMLMMLVMMINR